ncbi:MFS transporter [Corynebacterium sp.]|uniref:MFS transporter n=1 Tax=Corynebacterium sp. TaxID=1720 RepID=UPI0026474B51|nr:MFS transporter [Corynebacterium sp.]MDN6136138.1 MFS transporter [Corynebacterium sp.]MDN6737038.1 MFS transporter [Corynebacterium sp.]
MTDSDSRSTPGDLPHESHNARRFVIANGVQNLGDQLVAAKTVLPWLFQAAGVPAALTALLVPIRESGSMLPQAALTPWVLNSPSRKKLWIIGGIVQALAALGIAVAAVVMESLALGLVVLVLLGVLSIGRALCSITGKDVQGQTISKGKRGVVIGRATTLGGFATLIVGGLLLFVGDVDLTAIVILLSIGAASWAVASVVFTGIVEPSERQQSERQSSNEHSAKSDSREHMRWWSDTWALFFKDTQFRNFVIVRSLMLVSALSTSFIVALSHSVGNDSLSGLAGFVLASGLASLLGGVVSGRLSDISSRRVMSIGAAIASALLVLIVASVQFLPQEISFYLLPIGFFAINLVHTGIRIARKTYVVDMAEGDQRTLYVASANTLMGVVLLLVGGVSAVIAVFGSQAALLFLAAVGFIGTWRAGKLPEVSRNA